MDKPKIIDVQFERTETGLIRATSPQVRALHVAGRDMDSLKKSVSAMLKDIFDVQGIRVSAVEAEPRDPSDFAPWVIMPEREDVATA